jgi:hypothetical protein
MTSDSGSDRKIPSNILGVGNNPENWEPKAVIAKYGSEDAIIGEENVDYVALGYMNLEAQLYWLPRFLHYLRSSAPVDTFHFESINMRLANSQLAYEFKEAAKPSELAEVRDFLTWLRSHPMMDGAPPLRQTAYNYAVELWK